LDISSVTRSISGKITEIHLKFERIARAKCPSLCLSRRSHNLQEDIIYISYLSTTLVIYHGPISIFRSTHDWGYGIWNKLRWQSDLCAYRSHVLSKRTC
jgi:hypothetical protein